MVVRGLRSLCMNYANKGWENLLRALLFLLGDVVYLKLKLAVSYWVPGFNY